MPKHLERELERLQSEITTMARDVEQSIHKSTEALRQRDAKLAREVIAGESGIDEEENRVDEECLRMLALYQPVAGDLRRITAVMMIAVDLERMADLAEEIAERALALAELPAIEVPERLQRMTDLTGVMVRQSLEAFTSLDTRLARMLCRLDDEVDRLNREIIAELLETMQANPSLVESGLSLFSATRHLEQIADHATSIAEDVIYLVEGEIVRHHPEALAVCDPLPAGARAG
jgi:phosphate transport system protein